MLSWDSKLIGYGLLLKAMNGVLNLWITHFYKAVRNTHKLFIGFMKYKLVSNYDKGSETW